MPGNPNINPRFKSIFINVMRTHNKGLRYCECGGRPKVVTLDFSTIEIDCCMHLGCMTLTRRDEKYEDFCLRAINAWNYGEYDHMSRN